MKVLVVENEERLSEAIAWHLKEEGSLCEVVPTYSSAIEKAARYSYDRIIIDINIPDRKDFDIVETLKKISAAAGAGQDFGGNKIKGAGAENSFPVAEYNTTKSVITENNIGAADEITINEVRIIPGLYELYINDTLINLTKKEFDLLLYFVVNRDRIITKESIIESVWKDYRGGVADSCNFIYTHIKNIRKKMMAVGGKYYIQNIHRVGYRFKMD